MLRSDYDIQSNGVHFFNVLEAKYDPNKQTPIAFYNMYRTIISNNLAKRGDVLKYKSGEILENDEKFTPMLEDLVLLDVIREIDSRLPGLVKSFYFHKMKKDERLMDFKTDILLNVPYFLQKLNAAGDEEAALGAFKLNQAKRRQFKNKNTDFYHRLYCRICYLAKQPRSIYTAHSVGDQACPSLSALDRKKFIENAKLTSIHEEIEVQDVDDDELAEMYGYGLHYSNNETYDDEQVN